MPWRFTLMIKAAPGTDIFLSEESVLGYRAFANKFGMPRDFFS